MSRNCDWMRTISGRKFWPMDPDIADLDLGDITHSLSLICRFGGHVPELYSVGQHSVILARLVPDELKPSALMHDAAEAYLNDLIRPVKHGLKAYCSAENRILRLVARRYGLHWPMPPEIKRWDYALSVHEADTFQSRVDDWTSPYDVLPKIDMEVLPLRDDDVRMLFRAWLTQLNITEGGDAK